MKRETLEIKEHEYLTSYTGKPLHYKNIQIEVYDKDCASPSCMAIRMEEMTKKGRTSTISGSLKKVDLLRLKEILNSLEF